MNFDPKRIIAGAPQKLNVTGGFVGDTIIWTAKQTQPYCEVDGGYDPDGPATSTKTATYVLDSSSPVHYTCFCGVHLVIDRAGDHATCG